VTDDPLGACCGHAKAAHPNGKGCRIQEPSGKNPPIIIIPCGCRKFRAVPEPERQIELLNAIGIGD
jgi:hypothetical protein